MSVPTFGQATKSIEIAVDQRFLFGPRPFLDLQFAPDGFCFGGKLLVIEQFDNIILRGVTSALLLTMPVNTLTQVMRVSHII